ncbi:hypothetical protein ACFHYQ_08170 [Sphaerimonospora cavernae]|uniref:DNA primase DNAG catalytic core N-terminal domain-containing protein n=1 Tax=Sphaerimonospora cavernae TaxID=1740611 RepID=A0ABV6U1E2_9ACTN
MSRQPAPYPPKPNAPEKPNTGKLSAAQAVRPGRTHGALAEPSDARTPATREQPTATSRAALPEGKIHDIHREAEQFFARQLGRGWPLPYLRTRGIDAATARAWRIGYAPSGRKGLVAHLRGRGYEDTLIEAAGLARRRDFRLVDAFQDRIVLTLRTEAGDIAGFIARHSPKGRGPKYLANRGAAKGSVLYGLAENRRLLAAGACPVIREPRWFRGGRPGSPMRRRGRRADQRDLVYCGAGPSSRNVLQAPRRRTCLGIHCPALDSEGLRGERP